MASEEVSGASNNQRLLAAAREDNEDLLLEVLEAGDIDVNFQDGIGNTALHYAVINASLDILDHILEHESCDVDPVNRLDGATPLHIAIQKAAEETDPEGKEARTSVVESLLEAGADTHIKDKNGDVALDLVPKDDTKLRALIRKAQAEASVSLDDVASDDDGEGAGSGSGSESE